MNFGGPMFVLAIIAISTVGWIVTTWIRAANGYPLEGEWGGKVTKDDRATGRLVAENDELKATVGRLEERLKVLERIATYPSQKLSNEIEQLR